MKLFISYAHDNEYLVRTHIVQILRDAGHDPWFDHALIPGMPWQDQLAEAIESSEAFVYALTPKSVASEYCRWEFEYAVATDKPVVPVLLEKCDLPDDISSLQWVDFTQGAGGRSVARLLRGLTRIEQSQIILQVVNPTDIPAQADTIDIDELQDQIDSVQQTLNDEREQRKRTAEENQALQNQLATLQSRLTQVLDPEEVQAQIDALEQQLNDEQLQREKSITENRRLRQQLAALQQRLDNATAEPEPIPIEAVTHDKIDETPASQYADEASNTPEMVPPRTISEQSSSSRKWTWVGIVLLLLIGGGIVLSGAFSTSNESTNSLVPTSNLSASELYNQGNNLRNENDYEGAILRYSQAIQVDPDYVGAYINRGVVYFDLEQYEDAIADFDQAIQLDPESTLTHNNRGLAYYFLEQYENAIVDFDKAIELDPDYRRAYNNRGWAFYNLERFDGAIDDYNQALSINPSYAHAHWGLGNVYYDQDQLDLALEHYETYLELAGDSAESFIVNRVEALRGD